MNLLLRLQTIQDLLSEKTGLCLTLYNRELEEITIPSGLPQPCFMAATSNSKCLHYISRKLELAQQQNEPALIHCHNNLHAFAYETGIEQAQQKLFLVGGRTANAIKIEDYLDLFIAIYGLPLVIPANKDHQGPAISEKVLRAQSRYGLTRQEINILFLIGQGFSNQDIATKMFISTNTVKTHVSNILRKLGVENRTEAALFAFDKGLIENDHS